MDAPINVLVVDDHDIARRIAYLTFSKAGCRVDVVSNGDDTLKIVKKNDFDLLVIDLGLPDMDGITVAQEIKKMNHEIAKVPIVVLTANGDETYRDCCSRMGINDYLLKPITDAKVQYIIQTHVLASVGGDGNESVGAY